MTSLLRRAAWPGVLMLIAFGSSVASADIIRTPQQSPQFDLEIRTVKLTDQLYLLEGAGGNVAVFVWDEGVLLVDDKIAAVSARVKAAIASITAFAHTLEVEVSADFERETVVWLLSGTTRLSSMRYMPIMSTPRDMSFLKYTLYYVLHEGHTPTQRRTAWLGYPPETEGKRPFSERLG